jgi:hypothetical protein
MLDNYVTQRSMRIDPDTCRDPDLLAAEVRRLRAVIAAGEASPESDDSVESNDQRRLARRLRVLADNSRKVYGLHAADCAAAMDEAASHIELLEAASSSSGSALAVIDSGFRNAVAEITRLRLTDVEREAVEVAIAVMAGTAAPQVMDTLRGLLERLG